MHRKDQGKLGESAVITQCLQNDVEVFTDFGDNSRIDLILNTKSHGLVKVQVKCITPVNGVISMKTTKSGPNYAFSYVVTDVDYFAVVNPFTLDIAWISSEEALKHTSCVSFRISPTQNNIAVGVRWFKDYIKFPFNGPIAQ